jgi:hypothetical protein
MGTESGLGARSRAKESRPNISVGEFQYGLHVSSLQDKTLQILLDRGDDAKLSDRQVEIVPGFFQIISPSSKMSAGRDDEFFLQACLVFAARRP